MVRSMNKKMENYVDSPAYSRIGRYASVLVLFVRLYLKIDLNVFTQINR